MKPQPPLLVSLRSTVGQALPSPFIFFCSVSTASMRMREGNMFFALFFCPAPCDLPVWVAGGFFVLTVLEKVWAKLTRPDN